MTITAFEDVREFQQRAEPVLRERQAEYQLIIEVLDGLAANGWQGKYDSPPLLALVADGHRPLGLLVRTPPFRLLLTELPASAVPLVVRWVRDRHISPPGVLAPKAVADLLAADWSRQTGQSATLSHALRIHRLLKVITPVTPPGQMRQAQQADLDTLIAWTEALDREIQSGDTRDPRPRVRWLIDNHGFFVWADEVPRAMAGCSLPTSGGAHISRVYTPPENRRRGYATALVAQLSQQLLDSGGEFCFLFTDLDNPTSNSIYRRIGYEGVCDYAEYRFEPGPGACL